MTRPLIDGPQDQVRLLPGERFDLAIDAQLGVVGSSAGGENVLTVTTQRAILLRTEPGKRTTVLLPLSKLTGVEVVDVYRATERLPQGLLLLGVGALAAWLSWIVVGVVLISLLVGGLPVLAAIYILTGYALPDQEGVLILHAGDYSLRHVLRSADARRDAYFVAQRLYELASAAGREPAAEVPSPEAEVRSPEAEQAPLWPAPEPVTPVSPPLARSDEPATAPEAGSSDAGSTTDAAPLAEGGRAAAERGTAAPPNPWQPS